MTFIKSEKFRKAVRIILPFILIPATVLCGILFFGEKKYAFIIIAVTVLSLILFISGFEKQITGERRAVLCAVMTALCVIGRFIPYLKPVTAIIIITGIWLGGESGFLCGALSAVISGFYFGIGPWTPFQMFAWGLIGLFSGYLSSFLKKNKAALYIFGAVSGVLFSFIMDVWTVLWMDGTPELSLWLAALVSAIPFTLLYMISNVVFLILFYKPFSRKFSRIKLKYDI